MQSLKEVAYGKWRDYDPPDAIRFYALRLHEANGLRHPSWTRFWLRTGLRAGGGAVGRRTPPPPKAPDPSRP